MTNLDIMKDPENFIVAYEKAKASKKVKKPFNTAKITFSKQLKKFEKTSFTEEDDRALDEDLTYI